MTTYRELTREELGALLLFNESWAETERAIYSLRNSHGPGWLKSVRVPRIWPLATRTGK